MTKSGSNIKIPLVILLLTQLLTALPVETGSLLGGVWFVWIIICLWFTFLICFEKRVIKGNSFAILLLVFWLVNVISYFISPKHVQSFQVEVETLVILKSITIALFSYYPFYYYAKVGAIDFNNLKWFIFLLFVTSVSYLIQGSIEQSKTTLEEHNVLNQTYLLVQLIPLFLIFFRRHQMYILIGISSLLILWGAKRGAILCMACNILIFFWYLLKEESFGRKHRGTILLIMVIIICIGVYYVLGNEFVQERLVTTGSDDDRSGEIRSERYLLLWSFFFNNSSADELLWGHGFAQTVAIGGGLAHQDWVELIIDNGLVGFFLYVILVMIFVKKLCKWNNTLPRAVKYALVCCIVDWCLTATYSMVYVSRESFILFVSLGLIDGFVQRANKEQRILKIRS